MTRPTAMLAALALAVLASAEWTRLERAPASTPCVLRAALRHSNEDKLLDLATRLSDPAHEDYGQYWSKDQMRALVQPADADVEAVQKHFEQNGLGDAVQWSPFKDYASVRMTAEQAERLLGSEVHLFRDSITGQTVAKTLADAFPEFLPAAVDYLSGVTQLPVLAKPQMALAGTAAVQQHFMRAQAEAALQETQADAQSPGKGRDRDVDRTRTSDPLMVGVGGNEQATFVLPLICPQPQQQGDGQGDKPGQQAQSQSQSEQGSLLRVVPADQLSAEAQQAAQSQGATTSKWFCQAANLLQGLFSLKSLEVSFTPQVPSRYDAVTRSLDVDLASLKCQQPQQQFAAAAQPTQCVLVIGNLTNFLPYGFEFKLTWRSLLGAGGLLGGGSKDKDKDKKEAEDPVVHIKYLLQVVPNVLNTPDFVKKYYGVPAELAASHPDNRQAVGSMYLSSENGGFYSPSDLRQFYKLMGIPETNADLVEFRGAPNKPKNPDGETELDVQWETAMAPGVKTFVWRAARDDSDPIEQLFETVQASPRPPLVFSLSYDGIERGYPLKQKRHINRALQMLGAQGITVLVASGDAGAFGNGAVKCQKGFWTYFPASSPWVTAVGATQLMAETVETRESPTEIACSIATGALITSGGGFSSEFERPAWQDWAVQNYLDTAVLPREALFNGSRRGYPDVSLFGHSFVVVDNGTPIAVDGTSASAPTLAGILTLYNDQRLHKGLKPLGFLNPLLYKLARERPEAFNPVRRGDNRCQTFGVCCSIGYDTGTEQTRWNPVLGLGSPNFAVLGDLLVQAGGDSGSADAGAAVGPGFEVTSDVPAGAAAGAAAAAGAGAAPAAVAGHGPLPAHEQGAMFAPLVMPLAAVIAGGAIFALWKRAQRAEYDSLA